MDVFLCTGERSGDMMAAAIATELQRRAGRRLQIEGLVGPIAAEAGVRNVFDEDALALVGVEAHKLRAWTERLKVLAGALRRRRPKVFIGIAHCTFNLPLGGLLPEGTHRILVGPPEIWGWQLKPFTRLLAGSIALLLRLRGDPFHWAHAGIITLDRGPMALRNFDELLCMLPMNSDAYRRLARRQHAQTRIRMVGHPLAMLRRTPSLCSQAAALRAKLAVPGPAHVLGIFPGSRHGTIRVLLGPMLEAAVEVLNRRSDVHAVVSVADPRLEGLIRGAMARAVEKLNTPGQLLASVADASVLLTAASHALMSSGTITLQAACLAVPGTVAYILRRHRFLVKFVRQGSVRGRDIPWALPNAILATRGAALADLPYPEFVYKRFRPRLIAESILQRLPEEPYRPEAHPTLAADVVSAVRSALHPSSQEPPAVAERPGPAAAVAETVLEKLRDPQQGCTGCKGSAILDLRL